MANAVAQKVDTAQGGRQTFPWDKSMLEVDQNLAAVSAAGAAAVVTGTADTARGWIVGQIFASYNGAVAAGASVVITDGTTTYTFYLPAAAGLTTINFTKPLQFKINGTLIATLSAGGGAILASLVLNAWMEQ